MNDYRSLFTLPFSFLLLLVALNCVSDAIFDKEDIDEYSCTFTNPIGPGADPWVFKKDDTYVFSESGGDGVYISVSETLTDMHARRSQVWRQPDEGWNASHIWAPEIHYVQGTWYIYYTAGEAGPPFIHQRSGVLRAVKDDPLGDYEDMGMLYTGDDIETGEDIKWAIDLTVLELDDQLYAIWSGWEKNADTDRTPQHLYIAGMENPWTISSNRVKISSPEEDWETGTELAINEGPQILRNEQGDVFIIYSASESWLPAYNLGQLRLASPDADPMNPENWIKTGPVFQGAGEVYGVGHASYTTSPDGSEQWILYHTKVSPEPGWNRAVHMQPFTWNEDGSPGFGTPVQPGINIQKPSGECKL